MRAKLLAGLFLLAAGSAAAQEMKPPRISFLQVNWDAVIAAVTLQQDPIEVAEAVAVNATKLAPLVFLNRATAVQFPNIAASPVPVLLPFDVDRYLRDKAATSAQNPESGDYFSGFHAAKFFLAGPAGYDAVFTMRPADLPSLGIDFARDVEIHLSGMALLYELHEPVGGEAKPITGLQTEFPDLRRIYFESHMRYLFMRYGALYSVSIECSEGVVHARRLSCQHAHPIAVRFLKALSIAGGMPQGAAPAQPKAIPRPEQQAPAFAYYPPGQLIPGSSSHRAGGDGDYTDYGAMRFPLAEAPAHTYSQMFMDLRDCSQAAPGARILRRRGAPFRCPNGAVVAEAATTPSSPYNYPWRDSFCEVRGYLVGQCPAGRGHQGQDIAPVDCRLSSRDADHCERVQHDVVAVRDGVVLRSPGQEGLVIVVNGPNEHIRFRYLHMNPKLVDDGGFVSGRVVKEGEPVGKVGNYNGREGGTSYHLHFDMHVPTKAGWVLVNPYTTLVAAYERLIGGRGRELLPHLEAPAAGPDDITDSIPPVRKTSVAKPPARGKASRAHGKRDQQLRKYSLLTNANLKNCSLRTMC